MKVISRMAAISCLALAANALEFNEYGHRSMAMGGAGVAVQDNPYAIFYNPALIGSNTNARFGYGLGGEFFEKNLLDLFKQRFNNIDNASSLNSLLRDNYLSVKIKNVWGLKAPELFPYGNFGVGFAQSTYVASNFTGSIPNNETNINNANVRFNIRRVDLMEIPLSYGLSVETPSGNLSWGVALKFMNMSHSSRSLRVQANTNRRTIRDELRKAVNGAESSYKTNIGIDAGFVYSPEHIPDFSLGVVAKNLNRPKFTFSDGKLTLHPQARLGLSYNFEDYFTVASDVDLTSNSMLSPYGKPKQRSQKVGIGAEFHHPYVDTRWGIAKDLRQNDGAILSFGAGVGLLEFGVAVGTKEVRVNDKRYPRYFSLQIGGNFEF